MAKLGDVPNHLMRWSPSDWICSGVRARTVARGDHNARLAYREILDRLWMDGGKVHRRDLDYVTGLPIEEAERCLAVLVEIGGLIVDEEGFIHNQRVSKDLDRISEYREKEAARVREYRERKAREKREAASADAYDVHDVRTNPPAMATATATATATEVETVEGKGGVGGKGDPPPTKADQELDAAVEHYLAARAMRMHPKLPEAKAYGRVEGGTREKVKRYMDALHKAGHPYELLVSLPALTDLPGLLSDPTILLRSGDHARTGHDGKTYGATCHAVKIDSSISEKARALDERQVEILRIIGTAKYVQSRGAFAKKGWPEL